MGRLKLGNAGWNTVITKNTNTVVNNNPYWENTVGGDFYYQNFGGVLGAENTILTNYYDHDMQLSHGIYKGAIQPNGTVNWTNWTGSNLYFGGATAMKLDGSGANRKLYMSTPGAGLLRRGFPVESGVGGGTNQAPVVNITSPSNNANFTVGNNITVNYTATDDNAVTKVELYVGSTLISTDISAPFNSLTWNNASQGSGQYLSIVAYDAANLTTTDFIQVNVNASGGGGTTYRYLMLTTSGGSVSQPINIQNIWWGSRFCWTSMASSNKLKYCCLW